MESKSRFGEFYMTTLTAEAASKRHADIIKQIDDYKDTRYGHVFLPMYQLRSVPNKVELELSDLKREAAELEAKFSIKS